MLLFFDTETTGTGKSARVVQLAWLLTDQTGYELSKGNVIIRPDGYTIPPETTKIHGISTEFAKEHGQPIISALKAFQLDLLRAHTVVAHNLSFDLRMLNGELERACLPNFVPSSRVCTMMETVTWCRIPGRGRAAYKRPKLQELYFRLFGKQFKNAHDALVDVRATKECYFHLIKLGVLAVPKHADRPTIKVADTSPSELHESSYVADADATIQEISSPIPTHTQRANSPPSYRNRHPTAVDLLKLATGLKCFGLIHVFELAPTQQIFLFSPSVLQRVIKHLKDIGAQYIELRLPKAPPNQQHLVEAIVSTFKKADFILEPTQFYPSDTTSEVGKARRKSIKVMFQKSDAVSSDPLHSADQMITANESNPTSMTPRPANSSVESKTIGPTFPTTPRPEPNNGPFVARSSGLDPDEISEPRSPQRLRLRKHNRVTNGGEKAKNPKNQKKLLKKYTHALNSAPKDNHLTSTAWPKKESEPSECLSSAPSYTCASVALIGDTPEIEATTQIAPSVNRPNDYLLLTRPNQSGKVENNVMFVHSKTREIDSSQALFGIAWILTDGAGQEIAIGAYTHDDEVRDQSSSTMTRVLKIFAKEAKSAGIVVGFNVDWDLEQFGYETSRYGIEMPCFSSKLSLADHQLSGEPVCGIDEMYLRLFGGGYSNNEDPLISARAVKACFFELSQQSNSV